jgi:hypothetical protein
MKITELIDELEELKKKVIYKTNMDKRKMLEYEDTIKYLKLKCKYLEAQSSWLDELCNYERESQYQLNGDYAEELKEKLDELEKDFYKKEKEFNNFNKTK